MPQVDKQQIEKWVAVKQKWLAFSLSMCGAYLKEDQITFYHQFLGQGTDVNVLDKNYDWCIDFTPLIKDFCAGKLTKEQTVARIEEELNRMIG